MIAVADAAQVIHKPPFWLDDGALVVVPFALPPPGRHSPPSMNHRFAIWLAGFAAVASLGVVAVVDSQRHAGRRRRARGARRASAC